MRPQQFIAEYLPGISYGAYRNHLMILVRNGLLFKVEQGGGRTTHGRGKTTRYRVNSPAVKTPHPEQLKQPDIVRSPEAPTPQPDVSEELEPDANLEVYERVDELLASGITPEQMLSILAVISNTMSDFRNPSDPQQNQVNADRNLSGNVTGLDDSQRNLSQNLTGLERETCQTKEKPVRFPGTSDRNLSGNLTGTPIHEEKSPEDKEHAAAADENLTGLERGSSEFFETLTTALADTGHRGIRPAQFADLTGFLGDYENLTGSPPDQRTADYIVGRVSESRGVRNVVGFARKITQDVLTTGEGFVAYKLPPLAPPPERPEEPLPPPDWAVLHLSHVKQDSPAQDVWDSVLDKLRGHVSRPAYETWLSESSGAAYAEGQFVVGTANSFTSEMLQNRMHPLIERALRDVTHTDVIVQYAVAPLEDRGECPICEALETQQAAAS